MGRADSPYAFVPRRMDILSEACCLLPVSVSILIILLTLLLLVSTVLMFYS
jgi:hypothetical protein